MIAVSQHDLRCFGVNRGGSPPTRVALHPTTSSSSQYIHRASHPAALPPSAAAVQGRCATISGRGILRKDTCSDLGFALDSTEISAAQALLTLIPSSTTLNSRPPLVVRIRSKGTVMDATTTISRSSFDHSVVPSCWGLPHPPSLVQTQAPRALAHSVPQVVTSESVATASTGDESFTSDEEEDASHYSSSSEHSKATPPAADAVSISLALDTDEDFLSPLHCFMRKYCVEAFSAGRDDVTEPRGSNTSGAHHHHHGAGRVVRGQVGIRCLHCKHRPASQRAERAVCFPSSLKNIYHSIETWQRRHSLVCSDIPVWVKHQMTDLIQRSRSGAGGRRGYWEESAQRIGLANTESGIRFVRTPGDVGRTSKDDAPLTSCSSSSLVKVPSQPVVEPNDRTLVTDYLFLLLDQMETCRFTEEDRAGGRSKVKDCPVGFPGMQCKHCAGKAGFGRYFPNTLCALTSANSDRNIFNHIQKCRRCPEHIRQDLLQLRQEYQQCKNRRGSRKVFFQRVWMRLQQQGN